MATDYDKMDILKKIECSSSSNDDTDKCNSIKCSQDVLETSQNLSHNHTASLNDTCMCTQCVKEKISGNVRNPIFVDTSSNTIHDWSSSKQKESKRQAIRVCLETSKVVKPKEIMRKQHINYDKWDKLAAELSDSDDSSVPSLFEELKKNCSHKVTVTKIRGPDGQTGFSFKKRPVNSKKTSKSRQEIVLDVKKEVQKPKADSLKAKERAERMQKAQPKAKEKKVKRSPVGESLIPLKTRFSWNFSIDAAAFLNTDLNPFYSPIETDNHGFKWRLIFYPMGEKSVDYVSVFLEVPDKEDLPFGWRRKVNFAITLVNKTLTNLLQTVEPQERTRYVPEDIVTSKTRPDCHEFKAIGGDASWGWPKFIRTLQFVNPASSQKIELTLHADLEVQETSTEPYPDDIAGYMAAAVTLPSLENLKKCFLLQKKFNKNVINDLYGEHAALHSLCMTENPCLEIAQLLLDNGANVNGLNFEKETPLLLSSFYAHEELVELLLLNGAELDVSPSSNGLCCVGAAAQTGSLSILTKLVEAKPSSVDGMGNGCCVPLKQALQMHHWECALKLVYLGCNVTSPTEDSEEYMLFVAKNGPEDCKLLFALADRGCNVNVIDKSGESPLNYLLFERKLNKQACKLWMEHSASIKLVGDRKKQQRARMLLQLESKKDSDKPTPKKDQRKKKRLFEKKALSKLMKQMSGKQGKGYKNIHASLEMVGGPPGIPGSTKKSLVLTATTPKAISAAVGTLRRCLKESEEEENGYYKSDSQKAFEKAEKIKRSFEELVEDEEGIDAFMSDEIQRHRYVERSEAYMKKLREEREVEMKKKAIEADKIAAQLLLEEIQKEEEIKQKKKKKKKKKKRKQKLKEKDDTSTNVSEEPVKESITESAESPNKDEIISFESAVAQFKEEEKQLKTKEVEQQVEDEEEQPFLEQDLFDINPQEMTQTESIEQQEEEEEEEDIEISAADILKNLLMQLNGWVEFTDKGIDTLFSKAGPMEEQVLLTAMSDNDEGLRGVVNHCSEFVLCEDPVSKVEMLGLKETHNSFSDRGKKQFYTPKSNYSNFDFPSPMSKNFSLPNQDFQDDIPDFSFQLGTPKLKARKPQVHQLNSPNYNRLPSNMFADEYTQSPDRGLRYSRANGHVGRGGYYDQGQEEKGRYEAYGYADEYPQRSLEQNELFYSNEVGGKEKYWNEAYRR